MTDLSPAAQAVYSAILKIWPARIDELAAAALRAAADQVVPVELHPQAYADCCQYSDIQTRAGIRAQLLTISAELEGAQ